MDTDRNLLLGVIAMQMELIDAEQFSEACAAWAMKKDRSLAEILIERNWMSAGDQAALEKVLERKLNKHGGDVRQTLGAEAGGEVRDSMRDVEDEDVNHTLSFLPPSQDHVRVEQVAEETINYEAETRSRYTLTRVHGEGGIGRVWLAHDNRLNRNVALKEIRPDREISNVAWQRFVKEAQVTGQLEHPNIVPVYEMTASPEEGETFYTMRMVQGRTLSAEISEYHRRRKEGKASPLELRRLLQAFVGVCNALGYAHSRGVIHRDLKPGNVMVGAFGEVIVLDWGLAKMVDRPDEEATLETEARVSVSAEADAHQTMAGHVLGTLTYMAPEQAAGRLDLMDRRTDIYGLGAILFSIVTGSHPHESKQQNTEQIRQRIIREPSPAPREVASHVPRALDAICTKAMAKERRDRYQKAQDLADDVQRWLGDEPTSVYSERLTERLFRLMRRHRAWTQSIAAALIVVAAVSTAATLFVNDAWHKEALAHKKTDVARQEEEQAKIAAKNSRDEAMRRFQQSRNTIDKYLTNMRSVLRYYPGTEALQLRLLEEAAADYEAFAKERADDPEIRAATARAWGRLGDVRRLLGQFEQAEESYRRAGALLNSLPADDPQNRMEQAYCLGQLGELFRQSDRFDEARQALADAADRVADAPAVAGYGPLRADLLVKLAKLHMDTEEYEQTLELLEQAADDLRPRLESQDDPQRDQYLQKLAECRALQGQVHVFRGDNEQAATILEDAITRYEQLTAADPDSVPYLEGLAFSRINHASALRVLAREEELEVTLIAAIRDFDSLLRTLPGVPVFQENRAVARTSYAMSLHEVGRNKEAREWIDMAVAEFNELWNSTNAQPRYFEELVAAAAVRGQVLRDLHEDQEAELVLTNAVTAYARELIPAQPGIAAHQRGLGLAHRHLARLYHLLDQHDAAQQHFAAAVVAFNKALAMAPGDPYAQDGLAHAHEHLGDLQRAGGDAVAADNSYAAAVQMRRELPASPEYQYRLAALLLKQNQPAATAEAISTAKTLSDRFPNSGKYLTLLGAAYLQSQAYDASIAELEKVAQRRVPQNSPHLFLSALAYLHRNGTGDVEKAQAAFTQGQQQMDQSARGAVELVELRARVAARLAAASENASESPPADR